MIVNSMLLSVEVHTIRAGCPKKQKFSVNNFEAYIYSYICPSVRPSVSNGGSPEVALTPKLGWLYPSTEKLRHLGNSVTESAWSTTAHSRVINIREHARHV